MKRFHSFAALLGVVCAIGFAMVPFTAGAEVGPGHAPKPAKVTAPAPTRTTEPGTVRQRITRPNVPSDDGGCGGNSMGFKQVRKMIGL